MNRLRVAWLSPLLGIMLAGCAIFHDQTQPIPLAGSLGTSQSSSVAAAVLLPAGNDHLLTIRPSPAGAPVVCEEPSPDWASAFTNTLSASGNGSAPAGPTVGVNASGSSAETITALQGRTAGVVALRDGLYSACQAYANGMIGKDAYSLILSQYGNLLVALANGPPAGGTADATAGAQVMQEEAVQAMLVACIVNDDTTMGTPHHNALLNSACPAFMSGFLSALPGLLQPPASTPAPHK
jgi:hypothetical protein